MHKFTKEQVAFIKNNITGKLIPEFTEMFNEVFPLEIKCSQIRSYLRNHHLRNGMDCRFSKGHSPFNKGKKGITFGGVQTQFKKGHLPHNYVPVGSERTRTVHTNSKVKDDYIDVKIADPNKWKGKHILIWEQHNGPVPKRHVVIFGDGNNRNFDPNNLILVSRRQLAVLNKNKLIQNDTDLTKTAVIMTDLILKIGQRKPQIKRQG